MAQWKFAVQHGGVVLAGKVALVTGASRGIGRATALRLAKAGASVVVNYKSSVDEATAVVREIEAIGTQGHAVQGDVGQFEHLELLVGEAQRQLGPIDILVNNAGFVRDRLMLRMDVKDWDEVWQTDYSGAAWLTRSLTPKMEARGWGRVINVSSIVGITGNAGQSNYAAAKGAMVGLTRDLAPVVAKSGVTINCVAPGYINTDATSVMDQQYRDAWLGQIPMGRWGNVEEVAAVIEFLASPSASYVTGQCILVDGGWSTAT